MKCAMLHFPLCRELVLGMPRIEIEFEFDMIFCFGIRLALCAVFCCCCFVCFLVVVFSFFVFLLLFFSHGFTFNTLHDLLKVIVL